MYHKPWLIHLDITNFAVSFPHPPHSHSLPPAHPQSRRPAAMRLTGSHQVLSIQYIYLYRHILYCGESVVYLYIYIHLFTYSHILCIMDVQNNVHIYIYNIVCMSLPMRNILIYHGIFLGLPHVQTNCFITTQVVCGIFVQRNGGILDILLPTLIQHLDGWWRSLWKWGDVPRQKNWWWTHGFGIAASVRQPPSFFQISHTNANLLGYQILSHVISHYY